MVKLFFVFVFSLFASGASAQVYNDWRGPERDGHYPATNLLKQWPDDGPPMLWAYEGLGRGFTSIVPANGKIYVTGMEGDMGYVYVLSLQGELLDKFPYARELADRYPGTRSTPTIIENLMYVATGVGKLVCMDLDDGNIVWKRDLFSDFDGSNIRWGLTENLIIDGDVLYCSPGGRDQNIVALNRHNGKRIWQSRAAGGLSAYCSPLLLEHGGMKILTTMMQYHIVGLDAANGTLLWSFPYENRHNIYPNTPIYHDGSVFYFSGYGKGGVMLKLSENGRSVSEAWNNSTFDPQIGGAVLVNGYIYGSGDRNRRWFCVDWETGEITHDSRELGKGTVIAADGMLYAYTERGELALIKPLPGSFEVVSTTEITLGSEQHWAHLVIDDGILYVRHGNALMAFNLNAH